MRKNIVVLSGAGISAESGLKTFRGDDGLWEGYRVEDVATPEAWNRNPKLVQNFYNIRRKACRAAKPNAAHFALVELENFHDVFIVTQNIDDLHERAGSANILHLHGEITKSQSSINPNLIYNIHGDEILDDDICELGSSLRPHVVWFGEPVPMLEKATKIVKKADVLIIVGTSLQVYPAAGLINYVSPNCDLYLIDPNAEDLHVSSKIRIIKEKATIGLELLVKKLTK